MYLSVNDGAVVFATHLVQAVIPEGVREKLTPFQLESDGVVCYSQREADEVANILTELQVPHTVQVLSHDQQHITKAQVTRYASRTEAIKHLINDEEPESMIIPNLLKRLKDKEAQIVALKNDLALLKAKIM